MTDEEFDLVTRQLDMLVQYFEDLQMPGLQERVFDLLRLVDGLHREGLGRLVGFLERNGLGEALEQAAEDPAVNTLLVLYDLIPGDALIQVERALDTVRPYIHQHGGSVEVLEVDDGVVHLTLSGACHGCAGSAITLQRGIEEALRKGYPEFKGIELHEPEGESETLADVGRVTSSGLISFDSLLPQDAHAGSQPSRGAAFNAPVFKTVARLEDLSPGSLHPVALENKNLLLANVGGEVYAVGAECPGSDYPLTFGRLEGARLLCPWHSEVFDVRSGKCLDPAEPSDQRLPVYPVAIVEDEIRVAVNVSPRPLFEKQEKR